MGLKDLTKAAQEARDAAEELKRLQYMEYNGSVATRIASDLLGVAKESVTVIKASNADLSNNGYLSKSGWGTILKIDIGGDDIYFKLEGAQRSKDGERWFDWQLIVMEPNDSGRILTVSEYQHFKERRIERPLWSAKDRPVSNLASLGDMLDAYLHYYRMYKEQGKDIATPLYYLKEDE